MLTTDELRALIAGGESDRVEFTVSTTNTDKFGEAICAFANDFPDHGQPGRLVVGVDDAGTVGGLAVTDDLLKRLGALRSNVNLEPLPAMTVQKHTLPGGDVAVVEVLPSDLPPVRYYRNPVLSEALATLGYVNAFGRGVVRAQDALRRNGNPEAEFTFDPTQVLATIRVGDGAASTDDDAECLATLKHYLSLMAMAHEARKPMFHLRAADGALGGHIYAVQDCFSDFEKLARAIAARCDVRMGADERPATLAGRRP